MKINISNNPAVLSFALCTLITSLCILKVATSLTVSSRPASRRNKPITSSQLLASKNDQFNPPKSGDGNILESIFTGGQFDGVEEDAAKIASRIKSVKDLGWSAPAKRRGKARPRHRAWGGEGEQPIQLKANYDESNERCVEKWLTIEEFCAKTRSSGAAADTVFVALAKGRKYAEREECEKIVSKWKSNGKGQFNKLEFLKTVKEGRVDLFAGWGLFLSTNFFFLSCIAFPTNPAAKALEATVDKLLK